MEPSTKQFPKRDAILACLCQTSEHPSADWVYAQLKPEYPGLSLATVYRNLSRFKKQGAILSLGTVDGVERFDGNTQPHVHFICTQCGRVEDLTGITPPQALCQAAEGETGGCVTGCSLTFSGRCRSCENSTPEVNTL